MKLSYGWVIVAVGALMTCVAIGAMFSLAVFLQPMSAGDRLVARRHLERHDARLPGHGRRRLRLGRAQRPLRPAHRRADRARCCSGSGWSLASRATSRCSSSSSSTAFSSALAAGAFFAPMIAAVTGWFEDNRSLAVSLVSAGMGVAPMTISPFARWLISTYDWRTAMLTIGIVAWVLLMPAALLVRRPPAAGRRRVAGAGVRRSGADMTPRRRCARRNSPCWRSPSSSAAPRIPGRSSTW